MRAWMPCFPSTTARLPPVHAHHGAIAHTCGPPLIIPFPHPSCGRPLCAPHPAHTSTCSLHTHAHAHALTPKTHTLPHSPGGALFRILLHLLPLLLAQGELSCPMCAQSALFTTYLIFALCAPCTCAYLASLLPCILLHACVKHQDLPASQGAARLGERGGGAGWPRVGQRAGADAAPLQPPPPLLQPAFSLERLAAQSYCYKEASGR